MRFRFLTKRKVKGKTYVCKARHATPSTVTTG